jgi:hypothetical protein
MSVMFVCLLELLISLFLPKFIGLELTIILQLIFYSQLLISDFRKWPLGFSQFTSLKIATGFNDLFRISEYMPLTEVSRKFDKITLKYFVFENFNLSFIILLFVNVLFYAITFKRHKL